MTSASLWVHIQPPAGWTSGGSATRRWARAQHGRTLLEWFPLGSLPARQMDWIKRLMAADLRPGETTSGLELSRAETVSGWPVVLAETRITSDTGRARRLGAFYAFLEHGGHAMVRADDPDAWAAEGESVRRVLLAGAPDFGELVVGVDQFYDDAEGRAPT